MSDEVTRRDEPAVRRRTEPLTGTTSPAVARAVSPAPGELIDRYVVLAHLGSGGMGTVVRAYDPVLQRELAVKVVRIGADAPTEAQVRLLREAQALARLRHPNVIAVHDVGTRGAQVFIAMELVEGVTLRQWLDAAPARTPEQVLATFLAAGEGLAAAHEAGLVHRDFKPENVMVGRDGRVHVLDFGLAREARSTEQDGSGVARGSSTLTSAGALMGTPLYMAPEQWRLGEVDARTDVFSFCVALFEALYHVRPFAGTSIEELRASVLAGRIAPRRPGATGDDRLYTVLVRGLAGDPTARPASMRELLAALAPKPPRRISRMLYPIAAVALVAASAAAWSVAMTDSRADPCAAASARVDEVWSSAARQQLEQAVAAASVADAPAVSARLAAALDRHAHALAQRYASSCRAARVTETATLADRRVACLNRRAGELEAFVTGLYATRDPKVLYDALPGVERLPAASACDDSEALLRLVPPPEDAVTRTRVLALETRLDAWQGRRFVERADAPLAELAAALPEIEQLGHPPLLGQALFLRGALQFDAGQLAEAETTLARAALDAARGRDDRTIARAYVELLDLASHRSAHERALALEPVALAAIERIGGDTAFVNSVDQSMGWVLRELGRYEDARKRYQGAITRLVAAGDSTILAQLYSGLGVVEKELGRYDAAAAHYQQAIDMATRAVGAENPLTATFVNNLAVTRRHQGRPELALVSFRRVREIYQRTLPPAHPDQGLPLANMGALLVELGRLDEARAALDEARRLWLAAYGPDHMRTAMVTIQIANVIWKHGRLDEALALVREGVRGVEAAVGPDGLQVAMPRRDLAELLLQMKRPAEAVEHSARALTIWREKGSEPNTTAKIELTHGRVLWAAGGDRAEAVRLVRSARERFAAVGDGGKGPLAEADAWLAAHAR